MQAQSAKSIGALPKLSQQKIAPELCSGVSSIPDKSFLPTSAFDGDCSPSLVSCRSFERRDGVFVQNLGDSIPRSGVNRTKLPKRLNRSQRVFVWGLARPRNQRPRQEKDASATGGATIPEHSRHSWRQTSESSRHTHLPERTHLIQGCVSSWESVGTYVSTAMR